MVLQGGGESQSARDAAWDHFCSAYWYPVYAFIRRRGEPPEDARDLTQGFFAKLIELDWLGKVEKRDTRFSTLLITILKNHLITRHQRDSALKRGGSITQMPLDLAVAEDWFGKEPQSRHTPEHLFEKRWAQVVMDTALSRLRDECDATGKATLFSALGRFLSREAGPGDYDAAGNLLGINSRAVAVAVHRLRADYRQMVREEVAAGLSDEGMVEEEMRALALALGA